MELTVQFYIDSTEHELKNWEKGLKQIKQGTFRYDGSMPPSCVNALYAHKVEVFKLTLKYLKTLDKNLIIKTARGLTNEGAMYYKLINS